MSVSRHQQAYWLADRQALNSTCPHIHLRLNAKSPQIVCRRPLKSCYCTKEFPGLLRFGLRSVINMIAGAERKTSMEYHNFNRMTYNQYNGKFEEVGKLFKPFAHQSRSQCRQKIFKREFMHSAQPVIRTRMPYYSNFVCKKTLTKARLRTETSLARLKREIRAKLKEVRKQKIAGDDEAYKNQPSQDRSRTKPLRENKDKVKEKPVIQSMGSARRKASHDAKAASDLDRPITSIGQISNSTSKDEQARITKPSSRKDGSRASGASVSSANQPLKTTSRDVEMENSGDLQSSTKLAQDQINYSASRILSVNQNIASSSQEISIHESFD